jgi:tRNA threonylcarbamoyladenosine biosynthesis protein TsaE
MSEKTFQVQAIEDWDGVAQAIIEQLRAPMILALSGPLGAGKTTLVQTLAHRLGVEGRPRSPTFSLLRTYMLPKEQNGITRLVHIDAYRLENASDVYALDLESELAEPGTIVAMEWPEQIGESLKNLGVFILEVTIQPEAKGERTVCVK